MTAMIIDTFVDIDFTQRQILSWNAFESLKKDKKSDKFVRDKSGTLYIAELKSY